MSQRSIAIFTWGLDGGAFTNLPVALTKGFWNLGVTDLYVLYLSKGPAEDITFPEGVKLVPLGIERSMASPIALAKFLRAVKPDVLISMPTIISIPAIMGWLLAGVRQTKFVIYQGDTLTSDIAIDHKHDLRMQIMPWLARLLYPTANGLTTVSQGVLDILKEDRIPMPSNRVAVIPNPVDVDDFLIRSQAAPEHPWLQHKDQPVIVSLGRLVKRKNYPLLLQAVAKVRSQLKVKLIILGEGPERKHLEEVIAKLGLQECVSLPGHVANPWSNIAKADVFVMSSLDEAFCLALVEAMACGVPVISTDAIGGGPRSILEDGKYGNLVPIDDPEALGTAIYKVLTSKDWRNQLITASQRQSEAFKPEAIAQQWLRFLEQL
ncbi:glycosyltransferase [Scytonema hofmannii FACHB-248]|uniref:Glycosyltransferase n=1 Tax=Scytonema hofmannii FACHB-248 TaxID=1842502 RepID=A0ABR8GQM9_9CYAN|nr:MULTISPECIES: glycosyltransferase [Nostocales]MBD2605349.1 glycosyltransferase [Scytonema hofmannii FACHB-248]